MKPHPYLRAYMAGALAPTFIAMLVVCAYTFIRYGMKVPFAIEKAIIFPVVFVPNLFGIWNALFLKLHQRRWLSLGVHGALLPFVFAPCGLAIAAWAGLARCQAGALIYFEAIRVPYALIVVGFLCALIVYYLLWKYVVGFLNEVVGIA